MRKVYDFIRSSLFLKMILIFFIGHGIFVSSMWNLRQFFFKEFHLERIQTTAVNYGSFIIDRIGSPPDLERAKHISEKFMINIRVENDSISWANSENTPTFEELDLPEYGPRANTFVGFHDGLHLMTKKNGTRYLISIEKDEEDFVFYEHLLFVLHIGAFTLILYLMYLLMRRVLYPIKQLREGVERVGKGDFEHEIVSNRTDELGKLVVSYNTMTRDVRDMIKSRDQLLLDVSHELRTPLTRAKLALEMMDDSQSKLDIKDDIKEIETMINELLETERLSSKYGGIKVEPVLLNQLLEELIINCANREPGIVLKADTNYSLQGDSERLRTLFGNLLDNALKYSSNQEKPVEVTIDVSENELNVTLKDYGDGIPEEEIPHIFEPFYRVDKSRSKETGGYGLGMHLCKKIIEAHNGNIKIESIPGSETTMIIKFPI